MVGDVGALLTSDKLPVTLPEVAGTNSTGIVTEPPAATVTGTDRPFVLKTDTVTFAAVMDRLAVPGFETVKDCFPLSSIVTLPNARLPGVTEISGSLVEAVFSKIGSIPIVTEPPVITDVFPERSWYCLYCAAGV
jgi:hypothetical protein